MSIAIPEYANDATANDATTYEMPIYRKNRLTGWSRIKICGDSVKEMTGSMGKSLNDLADIIDGSQQHKLVLAMQQGRTPHHLIGDRAA